MKTNKFLVQGNDNPHHDRDNGGHSKVSPLEKYSDRTEMPMELYLTMMQLVMVSGEAITNVMKSKGIDIARINYQDNGNWSYFPSINKNPQVHVHLYVRSFNEKHPTNHPKHQPFPDAIFNGFRDDYPDYYEPLKPYSKEDCNDICAEIERLLETDKYKGLKNKL